MAGNRTAGTRRTRREPKGDGEARLGRASRGYHGGLLRLRGSGPSSGSMDGAPVLGISMCPGTPGHTALSAEVVVGLSEIESVPPRVHKTRETSLERHNTPQRRGRRAEAGDFCRRTNDACERPVEYPGAGTTPLRRHPMGSVEVCK